uniref:1-acyl-sn-glycerol-3-phosphate acyltransferase n=1 Tax=Tetradesmus obliquus TaxID=3088 RepID=A0A383WDN4_TETOB|eukprot:jgi/Sobl393_1/2266/SZX75363.1
MPLADGPSGLSKVLANIRACMFGAWTFMLAIPLFIVMMSMALPVLALDKFRRLAQHFVNNLWAIASTTPFYSVQIEGRENLPPASTPAVYVANHQSFMDIYSLFHLQRPFKFISKTSNFLIPIVGWSMFLTGHIMLNRVDRRSQLKCLQSCIEMLSQGASCLFFPEGTRSKDKVLGGFKKGAFSVAVKAGVPVVPITLVGTGHIMLNRVDRRSQLKCLQSCIEMLSQGASCLFFPEGTRSKDKVLGGFKKGAFSVAVKAGVPVVPITLVGTGDIMPSGREGQMYAGRVTIVVHPMIPAKGMDADKVCAEARKAVASALPPELVGSDSVTDSM